MYKMIAMPLLLSLAFGAAAQQVTPDDPILGVWQLDPQASVFIERDPPRSETRYYTAHPLGIQARIVTVDAQGIRTELGYTGNDDGGQHPAYGVQGAEQVTLRRIDPFKAEAVFTHAGNEVGKTVRTLSMDGTELTVELTFNGNLVSRAVYHKQLDSENDTETVDDPEGVDTHEPVVAPE
ncbi:MAG TPA: hypothetical protein VNR18_01225 [Hyphomicrobiales bacterium]|nr:hypothetical protein [Hyphomicrobiales bacterium]